MNSHGMTYDDLSQAISESYLHLSNDDTNDFTGTSNEAREMTVENGYDTSTLMRLARAIDEQQHRVEKSEIRTKHGNGSPRVQAAKNRANGGDQGPPGPQGRTFISSHSTPLVSKLSSSNIRHTRNRSSTLSDVEETIDDSRVIGGNGESDRDTAMTELRQMIETLSLEELEEFKKPIETLITNNRQKDRKSPRQSAHQYHQKNNSDMYVTPKRSYINALSSDSGSSGEDDDDRLSLTHTHTNGSFLRKKDSRISHSDPANDKSNLKIHMGPSYEANGKVKLPSHENQKNSTRIKSPHNSGNNERISSIDEIENELDSAITTPPHSQEYAYSKHESYDPHSMNKSILATSDHSDNEYSLSNTSYIPKRVVNKHKSRRPQDAEPMLKQKSNDSKNERLQLEVEQLKKENLNLRIKLNELEIKLSESESNAINNDETSLNDDNSFVFNDTNNQDSRDKIDELTNVNNQLNLQLANSKSHTNELSNEIRYLKNKLAIQNNTDNFQLKVSELESHIKSLQGQIGNTNNLITQDSILSDYKQFYTKLQLNQVDRLTKIEMSNLIKNLMLSLLITDFEHLPMVSSKIGKFFKIISLFMDQLHSMVYDDSSTAIRPSHYLKNHEYGMTELQSCLDGMLETLLHPTRLPN